MKRHPIDKFGRVLCGTYRPRQEPLKLDGTHFNVRYKRLRYVADPEEPHDCVNKIYLEKKYASNESIQSQIQVLESRVKELQDASNKATQRQIEVLESRVKELQDSCLKLDSTGACWDAKGYRISNVALGEQLNDVSVLSQSCRYDERLGIFQCGNRSFNLVEKDDRHVERPYFRTVHQSS